jgi:hypothetical protein
MNKYKNNRVTDIDNIVLKDARSIKHEVSIIQNPTEDSY